MKAMVFAAGLGTRLRPLTNDCPKALVTVAGRTLLEIALSRLRAFGIGEVILNVHHFADRIIDYLQANKNFGMRVEISREEVLLDTGGGLKKAAWFFLESGEGAQQPFTQELPAHDPFIVHNVDVLSTIDLAQMLRFHTEHNALATLSVQRRESSRCLLFDEREQLCGRRIGREAETEWAFPAQPVQSLAFSGIHIVSPRIFASLPEEGTFSIIRAYLRLAAEDQAIFAFRADGFYWRDLGRPQDIADAERDIASGAYPAI